MFKHEKLLFHPVGVEQPNRNMQHCFKNSLAAQTISLLNGHDVDASKVPAGEGQTHVFYKKERLFGSGVYRLCRLRRKF